MIKTVLFILVALLNMQKGNEFRVTITGTIFCQEGGKANIPLGGATLMLISGKDTLNTVSNNSGKFSFSLPQTFEVTILAQYQGFDDFCETFQLGGNHLAVVIKMNQSKQLLEAAMIKSEIPFVRAEADTIIYNMAALEKMEGDKALDLFLQIPGFGINKGKITMWGENVDKTYVNGKLIYGDDPISALNLLKAEEVKNVRIYDTQYMADKHRGVKNSKKRRVIDVQTFKQFLSAVDLQAQTRVGSIYKKEDVGSVNPLRFSLGFDFDSNREMQQIGAYSNGNNINDSKNGSDIVKSSPPTLYSDKKNVDVSLKYVKKWIDAEWGNSLTLNYGIIHEDERRHNETIIDRTKTEGGLVPLHYEESRSKWNTNGSHVAAIAAKLHQSPLKDIDFYMGVSFDDSRVVEQDKLFSDPGTSDIQRQDQESGTRDRGFSIAPSIKWSNLDSKNGWTPTVNLSFELSNNHAYTYTVDTLKSSTIRRYLDGSGGGINKTISGAFSLKKTLSDTGVMTTELEMMCQAFYAKTHKNIMTIDYTLPGSDQIDYANSFDYNWNDIKFLAGAGFTMTSSKSQLLAVRLGLISDKQMDVELFPADVRASNCFTMPYATVAIEPPFRKQKITFSYSLLGETPALEQTRERVDNSNPLRLRIGNPDLKAPLEHTLGIGFSPHISSEGSYCLLQSYFKLDQNPVVDKIQYFSQASSLTAWGVDYGIPAGGTLTGYENAKYAFTVHCGASYVCRIKPLKGTLRSELCFDLHQTPEYDNDCLNYVKGFGPDFEVSLTTMPVKFLRMKLTNGTTYSKDINTLGTVMSEVIMQRSSVSAEFRLLKHAFCDAMYSVGIYKYLSGMGKNTSIQNLSCAVGSYFFDGKLAISISGSDLLGKAVDYSTIATGSEFTLRSGASLGRYCLFNIAYRFSNKK